jgi:ferredoxin
MAKVKQKHNVCIGCGACVAIDSDNWKLDGDKASLIGAKVNGDIQTKDVSDAKGPKAAAAACPVACITVEE